jgi:hypothetical protein
MDNSSKLGIGHLIAAAGVLVAVITVGVSVYLHYDGKTPPPKSARLSVQASFLTEVKPQYQPRMLKWPTSVVAVRITNSGNAVGNDVSVRMELPDNSNWWVGIDGFEEFLASADGKPDRKVGRGLWEFGGRPKLLRVRLSKLHPETSREFRATIIHFTGTQYKTPIVECSDEQGKIRLEWTEPGARKAEQIK